MAEFCKKHCVEIMGLDPDKYKEWVCKYGHLCEECGYDYIEEDKITKFLKDKNK
jgi:hypothetical protein